MDDVLLLSEFSLGRHRGIICCRSVCRSPPLDLLALLIAFASCNAVTPRR
jgi:hypothetical protein